MNVFKNRLIINFGFLLGIVFVAPFACASQQNVYRQEADAFCKLHNPEIWNKRKQYTALENLDYLNSQIKKTVKSAEFLAIFDNLAKTGYKDFYKAIKPKISELIGEPWQCQYAKEFYALSWVRKGDRASNVKPLIIMIKKNGQIELEGKIYPDSSDSSYFQKLKMIVASKSNTIVIKMPAKTPQSKLTEYIKPFRDLAVKHLSVEYY